MAKRNHKLQEGSLLKINILPQRHRKKRFRPIAVLPWLFLFLLLGLIYPVGKILADEQALYQTRVQEYQAVQTAVNNYQNQKAQLASLQAGLDDARLELQLFEESLGNLPIDYYSWSQMFEQLVDLKPTGITLETLALFEDEMIITGISESYQLPLVMVEKISGASDFKKAEINLIQLQTSGTEIDGETQIDPDMPAQEASDPVYYFEMSAFPAAPGGNHD